MPRTKARIAGPPYKQWVQMYTPGTAQSHKDEIAAAWRAQHGFRVPAGPLELRCWFVFPRPAGHYGQGRNAAVVKPSSASKRPGKGRTVQEELPTGDVLERRTGGDVDNLVKLAMDALNGAAYEDDADVARVIAEKLYVDQAGVAQPQTILELRRI